MVQIDTPSCHGHNLLIILDITETVGKCKKCGLCDRNYNCDAITVSQKIFTLWSQLWLQTTI